MSLGLAFDADVLIYAASRDHPLGRRVAELFRIAADDTVGVGSVLLLPEVLAKPLRTNPDSDEALALLGLVSRLDLRACDPHTARMALDMSIAYGLRAADSVHLATAICAGATTFLTNNRKDFSRRITEIEIVFPDQLPGSVSP